jgi:hypothetical protein
MEKIIISNQRIMFASWDSNKEVWNKTDIEKLERPISWYFPLEVEILDGVTFEDVLHHLEPFEEQIDMLFCGYMEKCKFKDFLEELDKKVEEPKLGLDFIEFYWATALIPIDDEEAEFRLNMFPSIRGVIPGPEDDDLDEFGPSLIIEEFMELSLTPLKDFKHIPIALHDIVDFIDPLDDSTALDSSILITSVEWTFFQFLSCIFSELSIYGTPTDQEKIRKEVIREDETIRNTPLVLDAKDFFEHVEEALPT